MSKDTSDLPIHLENRENDGDKIFSPTAARNKAAIAEILAADLPAHAQVLEIGSGTGEHAQAVCDTRGDICWQCSDPNTDSRLSQAAWLSSLETVQPPPMDLNVSAPDWWSNLGQFDAIFSANVIHIAPLSALQGIADGAKARIDEGGAVYLYGPFLLGDESAPSNLGFHTTLQTKNPDWGVRELDFVKSIFVQAGFKLDQIFEMPANNHILKFICESELT